MKIPGISTKKLAVGLHIAAWCILLILPLYLLGLNTGLDRSFLYRIYVHAFAYAILFYLNYLWLVPRFFFNGKKRTYFTSAIIAIALLFVTVDAVNKNLIPEPKRNVEFEQKIGELLKENNIQPPSKNIHIFNYLLNSILVCGFSLGLSLAQKFVQTEKEKETLEKERLDAELAFLKNQISPHFFFNTLNNIYTLIHVNTDDAQASVLKLSKLMRYLLYESESGDTRLNREIEFMNNYIDLMRLRLSSKVEVKVSFPQTTADIQIPPLLFVSFIENAFKHGISYRDKSFVHIELVCSGDSLRFTCLNSVNVNKETSPAQSSGIGLENIRKRLSLLYPQNHTLSITNSKDVFEVNLTIQNPSKPVA